jgi:ABC-type nitrate/sulfonate/bicarbonate transport system substrate-binding protein
MTTIYFERMAAMSGLKKGDYDVLSAGVAAARYAALKAGVVDAALVLPPLNFQAEKAGYVSIAFAPDYVKDLPFTGMAVFRPWAAQHGELVKRVLAATDASIAWLADAAHRQEAVDLLVAAAHAEPQDAAASYDLLQRSGYFEPTSKVSRAKLANLIAEERRAGNIGPSLTVDQLVMPGLTELAD